MIKKIFLLFSFLFFLINLFGEEDTVTKARQLAENGDYYKSLMEYTKVLLKSQLKAQGFEKLRRMIIVTSSFHCRRAYLTFKKQFPEVEVIVCPATQDLQDANVSLGMGMIDSSYYKTQISRECNAIINYSKNGSIADLDLEEFLPEEIAKKIEENQNIRRASNKQDEI